MPSPGEMGVGLDAEKMAAFDAAVNKRRDDENALITKNQAEAKAQLSQLDTERQTTFQGRMQANREKEQVKMALMRFHSLFLWVAFFRHITHSQKQKI